MCGIPSRCTAKRAARSRSPEDAGDDYKPEYETYTELETLNSMVPIWKRDKKDVKEEDYNEFYKNRFTDFTDPLRVITSRTEGTATYTALLFVPGRTPYDYYTKEYEKGLALYASGVLIMEKCADLLPDYFSFTQGRCGQRGPEFEHQPRNAAEGQPAAPDPQQPGKEDQERAARDARQRPREVRDVLEGVRPPRSSSASTATTACTRTCWPTC